MMNVKIRIKVKDYHNYNSLLPELFQWELVESIDLVTVAFRIIDAINRYISLSESNMLSYDDNHILGLRESLNIIAGIAEVTFRTSDQMIDLNKLLI